VSLSIKKLQEHLAVNNTK